jgi:glycosyltransferase involved in cell wall biosynthesis
VITNKVLWAGAAVDPSGYGEATRGYLSAMESHKEISIKLIPRYFFHGELPNLRQVMPTLRRMNDSTLDAAREPFVAIQHLTPEQWRCWPGQQCRYHIGMTTFETDRLPEMWRVHLKAADEIWTYSEWGRRVFEQERLNRPIVVIPHGVDFVRFRPNAGILPGLEKLRTESGAYVFGSNFDWTERKNPEALLEAYFKAFKADDRVLLLLKVFHQFPIDRSVQTIKRNIAGIKARLGLSKTPPVLLISEILSDDLIPKFYGSIDAYVLPSRGEG